MLVQFFKCSWYCHGKTLLFGIIVLIVAYPFEVVTRTSP